MELLLEITALAAGGDGVARDADGRVTFVRGTAPGDRVRVQITEATKSFARAELLEVVASGPARVEPPCPEVARGCGGCQWQQVARADQLAAKQAIVVGALRKLAGLALHPIADPCTPFGWRRRARFHVERGIVGLYARASNHVLPIAHCPQLEPALDRALAVVASASPPDGELGLLLAHDGRVVIATEHAWRGAHLVIGRAGIVGVEAGGTVTGESHIEVEPGLSTGPHDFAQASAAGNAKLIEQVRAAVGRGPGALVELYAGFGNFTRGFAADGWNVIASDVVAPPHAIPGARFEVGDTRVVLSRLEGPVRAVVLDPPRAGAVDAVDGIIRLAPQTIVYVSCDPATLARDAERLVGAGYRPTDAWPIDVMPQTSHVEVVLRLRDPKADPVP